MFITISIAISLHLAEEVLTPEVPSVACRTATGSHVLSSRAARAVYKDRPYSNIIVVR
ncbi:hypothetical protein DPMN_033912 [Dreissena polymorpha]|uniref:Secreted protein n=1 Tax=Dreissena polymorpha TaxID=45954 RepID=A0A9D4RLK7_DREPO|nr:hypothetical protein DPMN_033912 [Dreissena polymorpha]